MKSMKDGTKVFIAGSRRLSRLSRDVRRRIDGIVEKGFTVVIGDANGVDKAVQEYLNGKRYENVTVFCMEGRCRNNVGNWPTRAVTAMDASRHDFAYYSTKDRAMVGEADYGLMLWDGKSKGTLRSIADLVHEQKPVVVYIATEKSFSTLRKASDLAALLGRVDPTALQRVNNEFLLDLRDKGRELFVKPF